MDDVKYMRRALGLALKAKGLTSPNPTVGAVIVRNNRIIAEGWHRKAGGDHAEIVALKKAGVRAKGTVLYVTLEPCGHYGRTPPCVDKVIEGGIRRVVIAMKDPNPLTNGKSIAKLRKAGINVHVGVLEKDAKKINEVFIKYIKKRIPFVVAKMAQTIDGKIATATGHSQWITAPETREFARRRRDDFDAILVGINTVLKDNPRLNGVRKDKRLKKIILDAYLRIPPKAKLFQNTQPRDCYLATTALAPKSKINFFEKKGVQVILCPHNKGQIDLKGLFRELAKKEITHILIEGGAHTIGRALKANLIDKFHVYIAPKILGDQNGLSSVVGLNIKNMNDAVHLENLEIKCIGEDIFIQGYTDHGRKL